MNETIESLISALRDELQQYGEMLALLDQQQDLVFRRATDQILQNVAAINAQTAVIEVARKERERRRHALNRETGLPATATFSELESRLPSRYQPLFRALVEENNQCLGRVRTRSRQNHLLLSQSLDLVKRFVSTLFPAQSLTTYNQAGQVAAVPVMAPGALNEVAG